MSKIILFLFVISATFVGFTQDKEGAEDLVGDGIILHDKGDYTGAIRLYDKALTLDKNNYLAMAEKAMSLNAAGRHDEAIKMCEETIDLHPEEENLWTVYVTWGNSLDAQGKSETAIEVYDEGIAHFPDAYLLYFNKGIAHVTLDLLDESVPFFQQAMMANPAHAGSHNAVARMLYGKNRVPCILAFLRFFSLEPQGTRAEGNLVILRELLGQNIQKGKKNTIILNLDEDIVPDTLEDGTILPNDFATVNLMLSFQGLFLFDKENKKKSEVEKFKATLDMMCTTMQEGQEKNSGFYWDYYVPYFVEMYEEDLTLPFSYIVFASSGEKYVKKWLDKNSGLVREFFKWSDKYVWYKE